MKSWKTPTPDQVERAVALLGHAEQHRYFFDRLENPDWIPPLKSKGFFSNPPKPQRDHARGTIGFPPWPESRYLARMALLRPEAVLDIILQIPDTENVRVYEDLADAALNVPPELTAHLLERAKTWARSPHQLLLPEKLGALVAHLANGGQIDAALELARVLLEILPGSRVEGASKLDEIYRLPPEPRARFDTWNYERIVKKDFPEVVKAARIQAFEVLCDLLQVAIRLALGRVDEEGPEDYSYIWRSAIEDHAQNHTHSLKSILVYAVRNSAEFIAETNTAHVPELVRILEARPWRIFHRIALHLLRKFGNEAPDLVITRLTDRALFDDTHVRHEYALLAGERFGVLGPREQGVILGWISDGPDLERFKETEEQWSGKRPTDEDAARYGRFWQRDRLAWFKKHLPEEWQRRYEALVAECGEPEHPEFASFSGSWVGPTSPKSAEELRAMTVEAVVGFLKSWEPSGTQVAPSPEGLGRELSAVIGQAPERFSAEAEKFEGLDPTYVRSLLSGLRDAAKQKPTFSWPPVLDLCCWVVNQPREIPGRKSEYRDLDPGWGWTRKSISDLLSTGFEGGPTEIPFDLRTAAWSVLRVLTDDPDPTPADEARYGGPNMDPATLSINTTRGEALHAVIHYALWVRRHLEKLPDAEERLARGFDEMPEVREVLDEHLELSRDPSLAVRSVYGRWFPWLVLLDSSWARDHVAKIFPLSEAERAYRDAAWETYVIFCAPYDNVFALLHDQYGAAVERLGITAEGKRLLSDPDEQLTEHLMTFYWRGKLDISDPEGLWGRFWSKGSVALRGHALEFIGRSLKNTHEAVPPEILQRLQALWASRLAAAKEAPTLENYGAEIAAFGWWFMSGKFENSWAVSQLIQALRIAGKIDPDYLVVERLAGLAQTMPNEAVQCLEAIVRGDREGWGIHGWRDHARAILETAIQSSNAEAATAADNLIHDLGRRGHFEFRNLVQKR